MDNATLRKALETAAELIKQKLAAESERIIKAAQANYLGWAAEDGPEVGSDRPFRFPLGVAIHITPSGREADVKVALKWGVKYTSESTGHVSSEPELPMQGASAN